jgi:hypothetical protein
VAGVEVCGREAGRIIGKEAESEMWRDDGWFGVEEKEDPRDNLLKGLTERDGGRKREFGFARTKWETNRCKVGILEIASSAPDQRANDARKDEGSRLE